MTSIPEKNDKKVEESARGFTRVEGFSENKKNIAVIGGGINGVMSAWALMDRGYCVELYESREPMSQTSSASTKMLHGGLRYLAQGRLKLVKEALQERRWWLAQGTDYATQMALVVPIPNQHLIKALWIGLGVKLYDLLASGSGFPTSRWLNRRTLASTLPGLDTKKFLGGWMYWDASMDDRRLGEWALSKLMDRGLRLKREKVTRVIDTGVVVTDTGTQTYDVIVNAAGPWAQTLLSQSGIPSKYGLDLIKGSHIICDRPWPHGLAVPHKDGRLIFLLPWKGQLLIGTTERHQATADSIEASKQEIEELLNAANHVVALSLSEKDIVSTFSGLRPVVKTLETKVESNGPNSQAMSSASRESTVEAFGRIVTLWGGKWTTARQQGLAVAQAVTQLVTH
ncbi:MAG: FAD-dependent oxidoreductase [Burkholderiaceae bacterium]